jgi:cell wall-associated NlpC family hydrolase
MSIEAAIGRIDQILTLQQQVHDPASLVSPSSATSGGASLTAGSSSTGSTDFASALASAQGQTSSASTLEAASALDPAAAALGDTSLPTTSTTSPLDASGLLSSTGLVGSTALPGSTSGIATGGVSTASGVATGGVSTGASSQVQAMTDEANSLVGKPYVWGGGHSGWGPQAGYDCSGFVSAVLHAGGYLSSPADTVTLPSQSGIEQGPGQYVTIYDRTGSGENGHVIIDINGQFYESGGESGAWGGGGGVEKIGTPSASYLATFNAVLHPAGL